METFRWKLKKHFKIPFKSYYVVWKQARKKEKYKKYQVFKSYYVVWKHS